MNWKKLLGLGVVSLGLVGSIALTPQFLNASDHDDGETDVKSRNTNLTDLYVFREGDQNPSAPTDQLIFVMNTNPRSLARQQYYFNSTARYDFNVSQVLDRNVSPTGQQNLILRFNFDPPDGTSVQQGFYMSLLQNGTSIYRSPTLVTTPLNSNPVLNDAGQGITVFAGLREDPFFFDVEQYFRVRAGILGFGPAVGFRSPGLDFTAGYNVNAIVVRVPVSLLRGASGASVFDVWETIAQPLGSRSGAVGQVERLARPVINEGLVVKNEFLNTLNAVSPRFEAAALAGQQPQADKLAPIAADIQTYLKALGNSTDEANKLIAAFLPDVMRIDTTLPSNYSPSIPASCLNALGSPVCGRKITDDVFDLTVSVLTKGAVTGDNVSYEGPNLGGSSHKPVLGQFPYLPDPN
jgi:hypothetical protein